MRYGNRYEKEIVASAKLFAETNGISFSTMHALIVLNTIRQVRKDFLDNKIVYKSVNNSSNAK